MVYTLAPKGTQFDVNWHFRPPVEGKVAVFLSGGADSTLAGDIYLELFGRDKVLFFYSDAIYCKNHSVKKYIIHRNVEVGAELLNVEAIYVDVPYSLFVENKLQYYKDVRKFLIEKHGVEFMVYGFTKLLFDMEPIKRLIHRTPSNIRELCFSDKKFNDIIEQLHLYCEDYMPILVYNNVDTLMYDTIEEDKYNTKFLSTPLRTLNKSEIVDLYRQRNKLELLSKTMSCTEKTRTDINIHCGACFNCQQRHDAYDNAGIDDPTVYTSTLVKERRQKQKKYYENIS